MPDGEIQEEFVTRLRSVGEWLTCYGDAIYGTRGGPFAPADWGVTTQKGDKVYVHILNWSTPLLALPPAPKSISTARNFLNGSPVEFTQSANGVVLKVPAAANGEVDRIVVLALAKN